MGYILTLLFTVLIVNKVADGNHVIEIFFKSWLNPLKTNSIGRCCDSNFFPPCTFGSINYRCETQFNICLQPSSFSLSNNNCPYGRYSTNYDPSIFNPDDIMFTFGVSIGPTVPNPMTFDIFNKNKTAMRLLVEAYDFNPAPSTNNLIDVFRFNIPSNHSQDAVTIKQRGGHNIGTLELSYRSYCMEGYTGVNCDQLTNNNCTTTIIESTTIADSESTITSNVIYLPHTATSDATTTSNVIYLSPTSISDVMTTSNVIHLSLTSISDVMTTSNVIYLSPKCNASAVTTSNVVNLSSNTGTTDGTSLLIIGSLFSVCFVCLIIMVILNVLLIILFIKKRKRSKNSHVTCKTNTLTEPIPPTLTSSSGPHLFHQKGILLQSTQSLPLDPLSSHQFIFTSDDESTAVYSTIPHSLERIESNEMVPNPSYESSLVIQQSIHI